MQICRGLLELYHCCSLYLYDNDPLFKGCLVQNWSAKDAMSSRAHTQTVLHITPPHPAHRAWAASSGGYMTRQKSEKKVNKKSGHGQPDPADIRPDKTDSAT